MLAEAESDAEQALALQIALGERLRELREHSGPEGEIERLEKGLRLLRGGQFVEAMQSVEAIFSQPDNS